MRTIEYSGALCAAGKTEYACNLIASMPGKYLLAVDRREVIETRIARIEEKAGEHGTYPVFRPIYSPDEARFENGTSDVRRAIREQPTKDNDTPHVVVVCTHAGLTSSDLSTYQGWTLIIDENPNLWNFGEASCEWTWPLWQQFFGLDPQDDGVWSRITIKRDAPSSTTCSRDSMISTEFVEVYRRWESNRPLIKLQSWDDAADGRTWSWHSIWNPGNLEPFNRVIILANSFEASITYKLLEAAGVRLVPFSIPDSRGWLPRTIRIRYFAEHHRAGTSFWTNKDGAGGMALGSINAWSRENTDPDNHFWSCNLGNQHLKLPGLKLKPKVSGADEYKTCSCATYIYAAKPSRAEAEAFALYGISYEDVVRAREREDIVQFLGRSCWRAPDDPREIDFRVYDREQALFLQEFIETSGRPFTVVLEHVEEAGVDNYKPRPVGAPRKQLSAEEKEQRKKKRRADNAESKRKSRARKWQEELEMGIVRRRKGPASGALSSP